MVNVVSLAITSALAMLRDIDDVVERISEMLLTI